MTTFTETEIKEQPQAWAKTLDRFRSDGENIRATLEGFADKRLLFTGCGTSYYLALSAASAWTAIAGRAGHAVTTSDVFLHPSSLFSRTGKPAGIVISLALYRVIPHGVVLSGMLLALAAAFLMAIEEEEPKELQAAA